MSCKDWQEGNEWQESRDWQQLLRDLEEMVENHANKRGELFYYMGVLHEKKGNAQKAEQAYRQAVREESFNYWLYYQLGQFYHRQQNYKEEQYIYKVAYKKYRMEGIEAKYCDDGIMYILEELIQYAESKKQSLMLMVYRKYAARVKEAYKKFPALEIYTL